MIKIFYIAAIHALLLLLLATHDNTPWAQKESTPNFQERMTRIAGFKSANAIPGDYVFLGDSITQRMSLSFIAKPSTNYGIAGLTTGGMIDLLGRIAGLEDSGRIHIMIGVNDFVFGIDTGLAKRLTEINSLLPESVPLVWSAITPVYSRSGINAKIQRANSQIRTLCAKRQNCTFIDAFTLFAGEEARLYVDNVHLSPEGYRVWQAALLEADTE